MCVYAIVRGETLANTSILQLPHIQFQFDFNAKVIINRN